jgi:hypothetical protein
MAQNTLLLELRNLNKIYVRNIESQPDLKLVPTALITKKPEEPATTEATPAPAKAEKPVVERKPAIPVIEKRAAVPVAEKKAAVEKPVVERKPAIPVVEKKPAMEKFGTQAEKARVITVYRNGDKHHAGLKVTVSGLKFKTYDQVRSIKYSTNSFSSKSSSPSRLLCQLELLDKSLLLKENQSKS